MSRSVDHLDLPDGPTREWIEQQEDLGSPASRTGGSGDGVASSAEIWRRCTWVGLIMATGLMESLLVCGEYANLPTHGRLRRGHSVILHLPLRFLWIINIENPHSSE
jgi:hypothetical protein